MQELPWGIARPGFDFSTCPMPTHKSNLTSYPLYQFYLPSKESLLRTLSIRTRPVAQPETQSQTSQPVPTGIPKQKTLKQQSRPTLRAGNLPPCRAFGAPQTSTPEPFKIVYFSLLRKLIEGDYYQQRKIKLCPQTSSGFSTLCLPS